MSEEQQSIIQFCVWNGISKEKNRFEEGRENIGVNECCSYSVTKMSSHVAAIKELLDKGCRITICKIMDKSDFCYGTVFSIIHDNFNMHKVCTQWIPKWLIDDWNGYEWSLVNCCWRGLSVKEPTWWKSLWLVTKHGSVCTHNGRNHSPLCGRPQALHPKNKFKVNQSAKKLVFVVFLNTRGVILTHAVTDRTT